LRADMFYIFVAPGYIAYIDPGCQWKALDRKKT